MKNRLGKEPVAPRVRRAELERWLPYSPKQIRIWIEADVIQRVRDYPGARGWYVVSQVKAALGLN